jgi:hypothetical protein
MTDPAASDDDWNDLARELGVTKSIPPPLPEPDDREDRAEVTEPHRVPDEATRAADEVPPIDAEFDDLEPAEVGEEYDAGEAAAEAGEPVEAGEGQPGTGRKRRRRRRRRRKGGAPAEGAAAGAAEAGESDEAEEEAGGVTAEADEPEAEPAGEIAAAEETDDFDAVGVEDVDAAREPGARMAEEETGSEVLRDLIASWNVPSWDEIVSGLYRPG